MKIDHIYVSVTKLFHVFGGSESDFLSEAPRCLGGAAHHQEVRGAACGPPRVASCCKAIVACWSRCQPPAHQEVASARSVPSRSPFKDDSAAMTRIRRPSWPSGHRRARCRPWMRDHRAPTKLSRPFAATRRRRVQPCRVASFSGAWSIQIYLLSVHRLRDLAEKESIGGLPPTAPSTGASTPTSSSVIPSE